MKRTAYLAPSTALACLFLGACATEGDLVELGVYDRDVRIEAGPALPQDAGAAEATRVGVGDAGAPAAPPSAPVWPDAATDTSADATLLTDATIEAASPLPTVPSPDGPECAPRGCLESALPEFERDVRCQKVLAHAAGSTDPYVVPTTPDHYVRFTFKMTNPAREYARSFRPIISAAIALHHMKLYESHGEVPEGVDTGNATPSALRLVYSWSPGERALVLDRSVGMAVEPNTFYTVETHYNLVNPQTVTDASGFEICTTPNKPLYEVSFSRLGRDPLLDTSSTSTCTPSSNTPIQLLAVQAQMNVRGRRATLTVNRAGGTSEVAYDYPFEFTAGGIKPVGPQKVLPGDTLTSTCYYSQISVGGSGVADEFCNLYVLHWPAHTLVSANTSKGTGERCTQ